MSGLDRFSVLATIFLLVLGVLTYGLCTISLSDLNSYPRISPAGISLVPATDAPKPRYQRAKPSAALRIDFRVRPSLYWEGHAPFFMVGFCEKKNGWQVWGGEIYSGAISMWDTTRPRPIDDPKAVYSAYFPIVQGRTPLPPGITVQLNEDTWDLGQGAKPFCAWADYGSTAFVSRRTNVIQFSKEQVAAALREAQ